MDGIRSSSPTRSLQTTCGFKKECPKVEFVPPREWFSSSCLGNKAVRKASSSEFTKGEIMGMLETTNMKLDQKREDFKTKVSEYKSS